MTGFSKVSILPLFLVMTCYDVISCHIVFEFAYFVELTTGYQRAKFHCCSLSVSSFTEGLEKHNYEVTLTSFHIFGIQNLHILCNFAINMPTFNSFGYLNQILQRLV